MSNFVDCFIDYSVIATIGICKNAGKTTVLNYLVEQFRNDYVIGITSIGYDGEENDIITRLPKPRIEVYPGMYIATSQSCLDKTDVAFEKVYDTNINTTVGRIFIVKVITQGILEVSGPSMASQINQICNQMKQLGADKIIADGAAGRISYAAYADCAVLSIGAALSSNMNKTVRLSKYKIDLFMLDEVSDKESIIFPTDRIYSIQSVNGINHFLFRGAIVDNDILEIVHKYKHDRKVIVVRDASAIFITPKVFDKFKSRNGELKVKNKIKLIAVTVNPMTPYGKWYNKDEFMGKMQNSINLSVYNIMDEKVKNND